MTIGWFCLIVIVLAFTGLVLHIRGTDRCALGKHKWKLKHTSEEFDFYDCSRWSCNHTKGHHK